jgi:hypothetical protein
MKWISEIIYGVVIGHWLLNVKGRLRPSNGVARYVVVALHSMRDDKVIVGYASNERVAENAASDIEELTIGYMGIAYDLTNPSDRAEFTAMKFTDEIDAPDQEIFDTIRGDLCPGN